MTNAPIVYGITSSQRAKPNSLAIDETAVAKISSIRWSIRCPALIRRISARREASDGPEDCARKGTEVSAEESAMCR